VKIIDSKSLGDTIRSRRKELKYTQAYISEITGLSISFYLILKTENQQQKLEKQSK